MTTTWRDRLRYAVDEFFARGTIALIAGLLLISALIVVVIAVIITALNIGPDGTDLVRLEARRDEVAIGYRLRAQSGDSSRAYGVRVNPRKSDKVTFAEGDRVIVLAEA